MADAITIKALQDASLDAKSLEEVVNGNESKQITTRLGETYPSVKKAVKTMFENGGLPATPFKTKALMTASSLPNDSYAMVIDDTVNNGLYIKTAGAWVKSGYDPVAIAATDATTKANAAQAAAIAYSDNNKIDLLDITYAYTNGNMIGDKIPRYINLGISGGIATNPSVDSLVLRVNAGDVLYMHNITQKYIAALGSRFNFFVSDPNTNRTQTAIAHTDVTETDAATGIIYQKVTVPPTAKYLMINTRTVVGGTTYNMTWAVHKDKFNASFTAGTEVVYKIKDIPLIDADVFLDYEKLKTSTKNLYKGVVIPFKRINKLGVFTSSSDLDAVVDAIPVTFGSTYTISGLDAALMGGYSMYVIGLSSSSLDDFVDYQQISIGDAVTFSIDNPNVTHITFPVSSSNNDAGSLAKAQQLPLQVELGTVATAYEPHKYLDSAKRQVYNSTNLMDKKISQGSTKSVLQYVEMDKVRNSNHSTLGIFIKNIAPLGISYTIKGTTGVDSTSNNLFGKLDITSAGVKSVYANVMKCVNDVKTLGVLNNTPFTVPSGVFDNPNGIVGYNAVYPNYAYVHPSIDYNATGVAGFNYWMIASSFASSAGDALWEDEDLFVSNDAKTWQRVRSLYETDKSYTTTTLRLPPHDLTKANSRQYAFLPCPPQGTVLEMSMPANNGGAAVERQTVTLTELPWKHDPFLMIDGGYVYTYHTFILPYADRNSGKNKFIVCVRTSNGIDWDVVRSDGSTMRLTEESSKTLFTKSADGKYNFMHYVYSDGSSNPEIIKYGDGDYEFIYGSNFSRRFKGTTPYTFDFETVHSIQEKAAGNHPTLFLSDGVLNLITNDGVFYSTDRGATFSDYPYYPLWFGGLTSISYKKATCIGEGGKFIVCDITRTTLTSSTRANEGGFSTANKVETMSIYEYPSVTDFLSKANNGLVDGYIDVQIEKINYTDNTRVSKFIPSVSLKTMSSSVNAPLQRIKIADLDCKVGDTVFLYVTLNSRNGAEIQFGGIDIT